MSGARSLLAALLLGAVGAAAAAAPDAAPQVAPSPVVYYDLTYDVRVVASQKTARVQIRLGAGAELVRSILLRVDPERHWDFKADGKLDIGPEGVRWEPPRQGGSLRYSFRIDHLRDATSYDARCAEHWALFRADDMVPPARVLGESTAHSRARLRLRVPDGWSVVTPWERGSDGRWVIDQPGRRFDRPAGWLALGKLGVVRERIAGSRVAIAGPLDQKLRRQDLLALLRWTLPELREAAGFLPERILIVGAGDPMWRGGLSGPNSAFIHADRPLITADLTSPILHELVHALMGARGGPGGDWVVEGFAELYSLELLVRSRTLSRRRYEKALRQIAQRGRRAAYLDVADAGGDSTARAVGVLRALNGAIEQASEGAADLDDVLARLARAREPATTLGLRAAAEAVAGADLGEFFRTRVPLRDPSLARQEVPPGATGAPPAPPAPAAP